MRGAIPPLPQYAFMAWCSVKARGQLYLLPLPVPLPLPSYVNSFLSSLSYSPPMLKYWTGDGVE